MASTVSFLRGFFSSNIQSQNELSESDDEDSQENLERNMNRVDNEDMVPESPIVGIEPTDIAIPNYDASADMNSNSGRNIFEAINSLRNEINEVKSIIKSQAVFRVEGEAKKSLILLARKNFSRDIFDVTPEIKLEVMEVVEQTTGRPPKASEVRSALNFLKRKFSVEYRPSMFRKMKATIDLTLPGQTRSLFKGFIDPCCVETQGEVIYRQRIVLIMRVLQKHGKKGQKFWPSVREILERVQSDNSLVDKLKDRDD